MNKTLAELLDPDFDHYRSVGELARTMQFLLAAAKPFHRPRRTGPSETLADYTSCHGSYAQHWHSGRMTHGFNNNYTVTWQQVHDNLYRRILAGLCNWPDWRKKCKIDLHMPLKFPMAYQHKEPEIVAWDKLMALHGYKLPVSTLNSCHRSVNVLAAPELEILPDGIIISVQVTQRQELRSGRCFSRWDANLLTHTKEPCWNCRREMFAEFVERAVAFYKALQPRKGDDK